MECRSAGGAEEGEGGGDFHADFTNRPKIPDINVLYCVLAGVEISTQVACRRQGG